MKSTVYIGTSKNRPGCKVGFSSNPRRRLVALRQVHPDFEIGRLFKGEMRHEKAIHRALSDKRLEGEWFDVSVEEAATHCSSLGLVETSLDAFTVTVTGNVYVQAASEWAGELVAIYAEAGASRPEARRALAADLGLTESAIEHLQRKRASIIDADVFMRIRNKYEQILVARIDQLSAYISGLKEEERLTDRVIQAEAALAEARKAMGIT